MRKGLCLRGTPEEVLGGSQGTSLGSHQWNGLAKLGGVHTSPVPWEFRTLLALPALLCQVQQHLPIPWSVLVAESAGIPRRFGKLRHKWAANPPRIAQEADPASDFSLLLLLLPSSPSPVEQQVQTWKDKQQLSPPL